MVCCGYDLGRGETAMVAEQRIERWLKEESGGYSFAAVMQALQIEEVGCRISGEVERRFRQLAQLQVTEVRQN